MHLAQRVLFALAAITAVSFVAVENAEAQRGGFGGGNSKLELLRNEAVRKELDLVDDQAKKVDEVVNSIREEMRSQFSDTFRNMRNLSEEERREKFTEIREKMTTMAKDAEAKIGDVLLAPQVERLNQIAFQQSARRRGTTGALESPEVVKELGLTEDQIAKLKERAAEVQKEFVEKQAELREEMRDKILDVLTPEQQKKIKDMMGKSFEMPQRTFGRGGPGGDRGGRGGDRGGRGGDRGGRGGDRGGDRPE